MLIVRGIYLPGFKQLRCRLPTCIVRGCFLLKELQIYGHQQRLFTVGFTVRLILPKITPNVEPIQYETRHVVETVLTF
jgi:hypothetical protein